MTKRVMDIAIQEDMTITQSVEPGKVKVIVLDGISGKAHICEAVRHGDTIIETVAGKAKQIKFRDDQLL